METKFLTLKKEMTRKKKTMMMIVNLITSRINYSLKVIMVVKMSSIGQFSVI
jgi:hypothetical protein